MKKQVISFRADPEVMKKLDKARKNFKKLNATDLINAALYQFVHAKTKKQLKYVKKYRGRDLENEVLPENSMAGGEPVEIKSEAKKSALGRLVATS
jgi:hypothetical protein